MDRTEIIAIIGFFLTFCICDLESFVNPPSILASTVPVPEKSVVVPIQPSDPPKPLNDDQMIEVDPMAQYNCSDPQISCHPVMVAEERWKNNVVIGCTVAVALEILIVLLMVMYWRQIRWTLRKLTCPCDVFRRFRHAPMRRHNVEMQGETNIDMESDDSIPVDQEIQIYSPATDEFVASDEADFSSNRVNYPECSTSGYAQINFSSESKPTTSMSLKYFQESDDSDDDCLSDAAPYCIENNLPRRETNRVEVCAVIHSNRPSQSENDSFNGVSSMTTRL